MPTEIIKHTYQLKRGTHAEFLQINPILRQGEPGFEYDTNKLKIGNGFTPYNLLPYIQGNTGIVKVSTRFDFPAVGHENILYVASEEQRLYQWDPIEENYEPLTTSGARVEEATENTAGIMKLYNTTGSNTDGAMTQKSVSEIFNREFIINCGGAILKGDAE